MKILPKVHEGKSPGCDVIEGTCNMAADVGCNETVLVVNNIDWDSFDGSTTSLSSVEEAQVYNPRN